MAKKYYLIAVEGSIEPEAIGPFRGGRKRDDEAKKVRAQQGDDDALFWADVDEKGNLNVGAYSGGFFPEEEED